MYIPVWVIACLAALWSGVVWSSGYRSGVRHLEDAVAARDRHWQTVLKQAELDHDKETHAALAAAAAVEPARDADLVRLCQTDPDCRDHGHNRL